MEPVTFSLLAILAALPNGEYPKKFPILNSKCWLENTHFCYNNNASASTKKEYYDKYQQQAVEIFEGVSFEPPVFTQKGCLYYSRDDKPFLIFKRPNPYTHYMVRNTRDNFDTFFSLPLKNDLVLHMANYPLSKGPSTSEDLYETIRSIFYEDKPTLIFDHKQVAIPQIGLTIPSGFLSITEKGVKITPYREQNDIQLQKQTFDPGSSELCITKEKPTLLWISSDKPVNTSTLLFGAYLEKWQD